MFKLTLLGIITAVAITATACGGATAAEPAEVPAEEMEAVEEGPKEETVEAKLLKQRMNNQLVSILTLV